MRDNRLFTQKRMDHYNSNRKCKKCKGLLDVDYPYCTKCVINGNKMNSNAEALDIINRAMAEQKIMFNMGGYGGSNALILEHVTKEILPKLISEALKKRDNKIKKIETYKNKLDDEYVMHAKHNEEARKEIKRLKNIIKRLKCEK